MHTTARKLFAVAIFAAYAGLVVWSVYAVDKTVPSIILSVANPALVGGSTVLAVLGQRRTNAFWRGFAICAWGWLVFERAWPRFLIRHDAWLALPAGHGDIRWEMLHVTLSRSGFTSPRESALTFVALSASTMLCGLAGGLFAALLNWRHSDHA